MFCIKCGKPNDDDATFCEYCGAQISDSEENEQAAATSEVQTPASSDASAPKQVPAPPPTQVSAPAPAQESAPAYAAATAPASKKRGKGGIIAAIISSAAVIAAVIVVVVVFVLNKRPATTTDPDNSLSVSDSGGANTPAPMGDPSMTVNGKNIPVSLAVLGELDGYTMVEIAGKADNELFGVVVGFSDGLSSNIKISSSEDYDGCETSFQYAGNGSPISSDHYYLFEERDAEEFSVEVKEYVPDSSIEILVAGKREMNGRTFEFQAGGRVNFRRDYEQECNNWLNRNRIPAPNPGNNQETSTTPPQQPSVNEITIKGQKYSTSLSYLDLSGKGLKNEDIADLKYMTKLGRVDLSDNDLSDISVLGNITSLEEIDANNNRISDISFFEKLSKLNVIVMNNNSISDISCFKKLPNLKIIVMNNNNIRDISVFSNFTTIEKIWLHNNNISDISPIAGNKQLTELGFDNNKIKDISAVKGMFNLKMLCVNNCGITDISALEGFTSLEELNIGVNNIADFSVLDGISIDKLTV